MIICSCNVLTRARVVEEAARLAREEPGRPVTPGRVFRGLGCRAQCACCLPHVRTVLSDTGVLITCPEPLASEADDGVV